MRVFLVGVSYKTLASYVLRREWKSYVKPWARHGQTELLLVTGPRMGSYENPAPGVTILCQLIRCTWLGSDLHAMVAGNKLLPSRKELLASILSKLRYKPWYHDGTNVEITVSTSKSGVCHLLPIWHTRITVRIKFSEPEYLLPYFDIFLCSVTQVKTCIPVCTRVVTFVVPRKGTPYIVTLHNLIQSRPPPQLSYPKKKNDKPKHAR
jgi:hypothetical protein